MSRLALRFAPYLFSSCPLFVVAVAAFCCAGIEPSQAAEFRYSSWFEGASIEGCEERLNVLARNFEETLRVRVLNRRCAAPVEIREGQTPVVYRPLTLIYEAESPLQLQQTPFGRDTSDRALGQFQGAFSSLQECRSSRPQLVALHERTTGEKVLDALCQKASATLGVARSSVVLHLVSPPRAREPRAQLFVIGIKLHSFMAPMPEEVLQDLRHRLQMQGAVLAHQNEGFIWFYAAQPAALQYWPISGLEQDGACGLQKDNVLKALQQIAPHASPSFYCLNRTEHPQSLQVGLALWSSRRSADLSILPLEGYSSLSECLLDLPRLDRNPPRDSGSFRKTLGHVCVRASTSLDDRIRFEARAIEAWL
jgi:hypothetical protein